MTSQSEYEAEQFSNWVSSKSADSVNTLVYGEDAVRVSNHVRGAIAGGYGNRGWVAVRLDNGASNDRVYEARGDAVKDAQSDLALCGSRCAFVKIPHDDMSPKAARTFLDFNRQLDIAGLRMTDPDDQRQPIQPRTAY